MQTLPIHSTSSDYAKALTRHYRECRQRLYAAGAGRKSEDHDELVRLRAEQVEAAFKERCERHSAQVRSTHLEGTPMKDETREKVAVVLASHNLSWHQVSIYRCKKRPIVRARQDIWQVLRESGWKITAIAALFGLDHSTVVHGLKCVNKRRKM